MDRTFAPLLELDWVLDLDATIKVLYGGQEAAQLGYNPTKPGRPSHVYQAMVLAAGKLVLNVDTQAGNQSASEYAQPTLFGWLDARDRKQWPTCIRGDNAHASERMMVEAEKRQLPYLFKLRQTPNVSRTIGRFAKQGDKAKWQKTEQGWESLETTLRLNGWTRERRVIVSRRKLAEPKAGAGSTTNQQPCLPGMIIEKSGGDWYEYSVLVTSWEEMDLDIWTAKAQDILAKVMRAQGTLNKRQSV